MNRQTKTLLIAATALLMLSLSCKTTGGGNVKKMQESDTDPAPSYQNGVAVLDAGADKGKTDYEKAFAYFDNACRIAAPHDVSEDPNNPKVSKDLRKPEYFYNAGWTAVRLGRVRSTAATRRRWSTWRVCTRIRGGRPRRQTCTNSTSTPTPPTSR
jgi:hypothetical protein